MMFSHLLDILFPRRCMMCGRELAHGEEVLCLNCLTQAPIINSQEFHEGEMCRSFWHLLPIEKAASMMRYSSSSPWRALVTASKFGGRHDVPVGLGRMLGQHFLRQGFFEGVDAILPMPATAKRQQQRGYNQAVLLAKGVSQATGLPILDKVVKREGDETSQTHRNRWQRLLALQGCFTLLRPEQVEGRHIVLLDDVCTTGASLVALGETVSQASDVRLSVLTLMRTSIV